MTGDSEDEPAGRPAWWLSIKATAQALELSEPTVWRLIREGELPRIKHGRSSCVPRDSIRDYVKRQEQEAKAAAEHLRAARAAQSGDAECQ